MLALCVLCDLIGKNFSFPHSNMSLPPRFPQSRSLSSHIASSDTRKLGTLRYPHDALLDQEASWVDDLVGSWEDDRTPVLAPLRRCVSDSMAILEESSKFDFGSFVIDTPLDNVEGCGKLRPGFECTPSFFTPAEKGIDAITLPSSHVRSEDGFSSMYAPNSPRTAVKVSSVQYPDNVSQVASDRLMEGYSGCSVYGPNSPRGFGKKMANSEGAMFSAMFENASRNALPHGSLDLPNGPDAGLSGVNACNVACGNYCSDKASRRHAGQRSRMRKVQYIAELESLVDFYQALGADLAERVARFYHQRAALSLENNTLRQEMANLRRSKMIKEEEHDLLKNELKKLKAKCGGHKRSKSSSFPLDGVGSNASEISWQMSNLTLGESYVPLRQGFNS